jgi:hypothetical protein
MAAKQAQIIAAARAVFQTLSIVHILLSGDDRPVVVVCLFNAICSGKFRAVPRSLGNASRRRLGQLARS